MDVEEPEAALIISIACNRINEAAMSSSHSEIMNALIGMCKPSPHDVEGVVEFEPIRDTMMTLYGSAVDHPDFVQAFSTRARSRGKRKPSHEGSAIVHPAPCEPESSETAV